jgi:hypothetical protein
MSNSENVRIGATGAVYVAPAGTPIPSTFDAALDPSFVALGWISEEGVDETHADESQDVKAWQNGAVVRRRISSSESSIAFTMIETTNRTLELFHKGSEVVSDGADGWKMLVKAPDADRRTLVLDVIDGDDVIRIVAPSAEVTERGTINYGSKEIGYKVTMTSYPTTVSNTQGVTLIKMSGAVGWNQ